MEEGPVANTITAHHGRNSGEDVFVLPIQDAARPRLRAQNGIGVGEPGDPMYTYTTRGDHAVAVLGGEQPARCVTARKGRDGASSDQTFVVRPPDVGDIVAFDESQITSPNNRSTVTPGAPAPTISVTPGAPAPTISASSRVHAFSIVPVGGQGADLTASEVDVATGLQATALGSSTERGVRIVEQRTIRRLTPREVERCFGFPDDYTAIPGAADSPRYEALGNSMAVPVMKWIGRRLALVDAIPAAPVEVVVEVVEAEPSDGAAAATDGEGPLNTPLRWVGSKRWAAELLRDRILGLRRAGGRYFEPFLGAASVALAMPPGTPMVLSDARLPLMGFWWWVRNRPESIVDALGGHLDWSNTEENYYRVRRAFNARKFSTESAVPAATFLWLNKTCFNGLYRENADGDFNVPYGRRKVIATPTLDELRALAARLARAVVMPGGDFADATSSARAGDVVFLDPPYDDVFDGYGAGGFGPEGQARLAAEARRLASAGASVVMTNSDTPRVRELYAGFDVEPFEEPRRVAAKVSSRGSAPCLLITKRGW